MTISKTFNYFHTKLTKCSVFVHSVLFMHSRKESFFLDNLGLEHLHFSKSSGSKKPSVETFSRSYLANLAIQYFSSFHVLQLLYLAHIKESGTERKLFQPVHTLLRPLMELVNFTY